MVDSSWSWATLSLISAIMCCLVNLLNSCSQKLMGLSRKDYRHLTLKSCSADWTSSANLFSMFLFYEGGPLKKIIVMNSCTPYLSK